MRIFNAVVTGDVDGYGYTVGDGAQEVPGGDRMVEVTVTDGDVLDPPSQVVALQSSMDGGVTWCDLMGDVEIPTTDLYASGVIAGAPRRMLHYTTGAVADGLTLLRFVIPDGLLRVQVRCDTTPGSQRVKVSIN